MRRVLGLPAYRRLLIAYTLNELALGVGTVALAILIYRRTGSAAGAAAFFLASAFVPALISPALVSRLDRGSMRATLSLLYLLEAGAFAGLAWLVTSFSVAPVLALTLVDGVLALVARSLARATTVAVLKPADLLREGNALTNAAFSVCYLIGPAVGGAVVALGGTRDALLINWALFLLMALSLVTSAALPVAAGDDQRVRGRLRASLQHAREHRPIRNLLAVVGAITLFGTMPAVAEVVLAQHTLKAGAGGYGAILSAWGGGAVIGSLAYARWNGLSSRALITLGAAAIGAGLIGLGLGPSIGVVLPGAAVAGLGNGIAIVAARTALQEHVGESWMARITSVAESIQQAVPGLGFVAGAAITAAANPRLALVVAGGGSLLTAACAPFAVPADVNAEGEEAAGTVASQVRSKAASVLSLRAIRSELRRGH